MNIGYTLELQRQFKTMRRVGFVVVLIFGTMRMVVVVVLVFGWQHLKSKHLHRPTPLHISFIASPFCEETKMKAFPLKCVETLCNINALLQPLYRTTLIALLWLRHCS